VLENEVIKREVMEGEKAEEARKKILRSSGKSLRVVTSKEGQEEGQSEPENKSVSDPSVVMPITENVETQNPPDAGS